MILQKSLKMKTAKFVIIGGGVAGLCAAIRLAELGEKVLVIEGGKYPSHKVCGEFLSPECIHFLHTWNIKPTSISHVDIISNSNCLTFPFPLEAGGLSHLHLDPLLVELALKLNVEIKTQTRVKNFMPKKSLQMAHSIELDNGDQIEAEQVIMATGRIPGFTTKAPAMEYVGFKAHFQNISLANHLKMYSLPYAYLGIAPIENDLCNVACLADIHAVNRFTHPQAFLENLISLHPDLSKQLTKENNLFESWMHAYVPAFGMKQTPDWLDTYFIGDAAMTIPPACGGGLTLAVLGGRLVAEYALNKRSSEFKKMWKKRCTSQLFWAKTLHRIMLRPNMSQPLIKLAAVVPYLSKKIYHFTRQPN